MKRNLRLKAIDNLVESHWQDPIETIPETVGAENNNGEQLEELDIKFFSTRMRVLILVTWMKIIWQIMNKSCLWNWTLKMKVMLEKYQLLKVLMRKLV